MWTLNVATMADQCRQLTPSTDHGVRSGTQFVERSVMAVHPADLESKVARTRGVPGIRRYKKNLVRGQPQCLASKCVDTWIGLEYADTFNAEIGRAHV